MKPKGRHPDRALSAVRVRAINKPGRHADGNGLYLVVDPSGSKRWILRTVVRGRRSDIGLGSARLVSLADAREQAADFRKMARAGGDPIAERRKQRATVPTFEEAARFVHAENSPTWKNAKHAAQWISTLERYAFPLLGSRRIDQIETSDVLHVLAPIWVTKAETARRVRQRIGQILDWAKAAGHRTGDNPVAEIGLALPKQPATKRHHAALPYAEVPAFIEKLRSGAGHDVGHLAFEFLVLTATRTNEVLGARWGEFDLNEEIWTIPAERMKGGQSHRAPLSPRSLEIVVRARELGKSEHLVFPGRSAELPLSTMVFLMKLRRMGYGVTAHGFRSSFRDWASEQTNFSREVCELALAHTVRDKTEAAYRRGDLLDKRRELMATWAAFATSSGDATPPPRKRSRQIK